MTEGPDLGEVAAHLRARADAAEATLAEGVRALTERTRARLAACDPDDPHPPGGRARDRIHREAASQYLALLSAGHGPRQWQRPTIAHHEGEWCGGALISLWDGAGQGVGDQDLLTRVWIWPGRGPMFWRAEPVERLSQEALMPDHPEGPRIRYRPTE